MIEQLKKISIVSAGNIFNAVLGIMFLAAVARNLGIEDVGKYAILTTLLVSASKIIDFGSNSAFVAESIMSKRDVENSTFLVLKILLFIPALLVGCIILKFLGLLSINIFILYSLGLVAYGFNITLFTLFQKNKLYTYAVSLNTFPALFKGLFALIIFLSEYTNLNIINSLSLDQAYAIFSLSMFSCLILIYKLPELEINKHLEFGRIKELFVIGAPGGIALLIQHSWPTISNSIAGIIKSFANAGVYSIADKVASIFVLISVSVFTVLLPENATRKENKLKYDIKGTTAIMGIILVMGLFAVVAGKVLVPIVFGDKFMESTEILGALIFASALTAIHTFLDNYFYIEEKTTAIMLVNISKLTIFIVSGIYLTSNFGLMGLAYAQLLSALIALGITGALIFNRESN